MTNTQSVLESASASNAPYKIMIIDDHDLIINGLITSLEMNEEYKVIATAQYADEARQRMKREVNLVIMDIRLPPSRGKEIEHCGIDLAAEFHEKYPDSAILILSGETKVELVQRAWDAGVCGYVLKNHARHVEDAISAVRRNGRYSDPDLPKIPKKNLLELLTKREKDILRYMAQIKPPKTIANDLDIKTVTVNCHCKNIREKLNINNKELLKIAIEYYGENR
jgi:DNA-binding NarL/FixJ family response regulator